MESVFVSHHLFNTLDPSNLFTYKKAGISNDVPMETNYWVKPNLLLYSNRSCGKPLKIKSESKRERGRLIFTFFSLPRHTG